MASAEEKESHGESRADRDVDASTSAQGERQRAAANGGVKGEHRCNRFLVSIFHVENWPVHPSGLIYEGRRLQKKP